MYAFMVPAVMDVCPELFCPEERGLENGTAAESSNKNDTTDDGSNNDTVDGGGNNADSSADADLGNSAGGSIHRKEVWRTIRS